MDFEEGFIYLPKISVTVVKTKSGRYYVSILVEVQDPRNEIKEPSNLVCRIDLGLQHFAAIANDAGVFKVEYPKYLIKAEKRLKRLQRQLSRKEKESRNREKAVKRLAREHEYVKNSKEDFLHKMQKRT